MLSNPNTTRRRFLRTAGLIAVPAPFVIGQSLRNPAFVARLTSAASSGVLKDQHTGTTNGFVYVNYHSANNDNYHATEVVPTSSYTVTSAVLRLSKDGSPTFNLKCAIFNNNGGVPGTQVGTASNNVSASTLTPSEGDVRFDGMSAEVTSGGTFWVVFWEASGVGYDQTNFVNWFHYELTGSTAWKSPTNSTGDWVGNGPNKGLKFALYA